MNISNLKDRLESIQNELINVARDIKDIAVYTGNTRDNILEAELFVSLALDDLYLILD